jgi:hypothetical protein
VLDHAAGDAVAGVAGRIGLVVVGLGVDHQRRAVGVEQRVRLARLERDLAVEDLDREIAVLRHMQVGHVAGVALARHHAVMGVARIEMAPGGFERRLAFADGVNMEGMLAGLEPLDLKLDEDAGRRLHQVDVADRLAAGIPELGIGHFGRVDRQRHGPGQQRSGASRRQQVPNAHVRSPDGPVASTANGPFQFRRRCDEPGLSILRPNRARHMEGAAARPIGACSGNCGLRQRWLRSQSFP